MTAYVNKHALTAGRIEALRKVAANPRVRLVPNLREWLVREGCIEAAEPASGPRPTGLRHSYRLPGRAYVLTVKGRKAVADAERQLIDAARDAVERTAP